jgi:signal transduction histidine kinase
MCRLLDPPNGTGASGGPLDDVSDPGRRPPGAEGPDGTPEGTSDPGRRPGTGAGWVVDRGVFPPVVRWLGGLWVASAIVFVTVVAALFADTPGAYVFILIFLSCGAFTAPALAVTWYAARHVQPSDRLGALLSLGGLVTAFSIGVAALIGLGTGWSWANAAGVPAVALAGLLHIAGLMAWARPHSGGRVLTVDVLEAATAVLAVTAPLVVLWGAAVVEAEASWFTMPTAVATICAIAGIYWTVMLLVRLGLGRSPFGVSSVALAGLGAVDAVLQTAQGVAGFTLPAAPLVALKALCFSMYLLVPLNAPILLPSRLDLLPPQSQVRGARLSTVVALVGLVALWAATLTVADDRPWAVPFSFVVVSLLLVLVAFRHMAAAQETRRLYRQVEVASDERRRLLTQLLERSVDDRRRFASKLYEQAVAAYASFSVMAGTDVSHATSPSIVARASARVGVDLARQAESVRELALAIRPREGERGPRERLGIPLRAYLASIYGDRMAPRLAVDVAEELVLDWVTETVLLQVVQEALQNVWQHSQATSVEVSIQVAGVRVAVRVTDDGIGFDPAAVPEGAGLATMRAAVAVVEGTLVIDAQPGRGTTVLAHLGPDRPDRPPRPDRPGRADQPGRAGGPAGPPQAGRRSPALRVVRND